MALIFLVEDDITLQRAYRSVLETAGYAVISALNGYDAILKYELLPEEPDKILLDHRMPEKEGLATAEEILAMNPGAAIIFLSADIIVKHSALQMGAGFLTKPFTREELLLCIRDIKAQPLQHILTLVSSADDKREKVLPFLRHGFYRKEKCLYLTCEPSIETARKNLILTGIKEELLSLITIYPVKEWLSDIEINPQTVIDRLDHFMSDNLTTEINKLRIVIEIDVSKFDLDSLFNSEENLHVYLQEHPNVRLLCAYQLDEDMGDIKTKLLHSLKEIGLQTSFSGF